MSTESVSLGVVIYSCVKPIFKIYLILGTGFLLAKVDILNGETIKMISRIVLTVLLPSLSFNKIVGNIDDSLIKDVGIICLSSVLMYAAGFFCGYVVKLFLPVPKRWHGGLICTSMFPNISDLPIAYLQAMDNNVIFTQSQTDQGTAMVIIFLVTFLLAIFNFGGFQLVEMDFKDDVKNDDEENSLGEVDSDHNAEDFTSSKDDLHDLPDSQESTTQSLDSNRDSQEIELSSLHSNDQSNINLPGLLSPQQYVTNADNVSSSTGTNINKESRGSDRLSVTSSLHRRNSIAQSIISNTGSSSVLNLRKVPTAGNNALIREYSRVDTMGHRIPENSLARHLSIQALQQDQDLTLDELTAPGDNQSLVSTYARTSAAATANEAEDQDHHDNASILTRIRTSRVVQMVTEETNIQRSDIDESGKNLKKQFQFMKYVIFFAKNCLRPCSFACILALIITFIPWVRGLFVYTANAHIPNAPDGDPPLSFIMDYTSYVGAASVPFGLLLLGGTLGNLKINSLYPGFWKSALALVILRQIVMPILGVLWCDRLVDAGWVTKSKDKMLLFVIAINWALPSMTTMIYLTAACTPIDATETVQMDCVSFTLLLQYPFLVISLPFLATYFLKVQLNV